MRTVRNPRQTRLFDPFDPVLTERTRQALLVIKAFMDRTEEEAVSAYRFHLDVHYALNLEPMAQDLSVRPLERYAHVFV